MAFNYNSISTSHAYMATIAGLILVIQPSVLFSFLDMEVSPSVVLVGRLFGAFLVGLSAAIYSTKDLSGENIPIVLVVGNAGVDFVTTMIFLQASFAETVNWIGFILAGLFFTNFISWLIVIAQYSKAKQSQFSPS